MGKQHSECALCGKTIINVQESSVLKEVVGGISYNFDTNQCVIMYKRLIRVYGDGFNFLAPRDRLNKKEIEIEKPTLEPPTIRYYCKTRPKF